MEYEIVELPARRIAGVTVRTANDAPDCVAKIGQLWARFMGAGEIARVPQPVSEPYTCFGAYYGYDMAGGGYGVMVGCETAGDEVPEGMEALEVAAGRFAKFAIRGGDRVGSVQEVWNAIWADADLTAQRAFTTDFEAYLPGEDAANADIDIFVALA
ncbi:GyrI-like domain-containing protein [Arabiibacter massiliensis]|uniref:GyrI-like domain-containing protein n=1 Tax=Arabiibacter massiliensis TaxID=1870985 RepID=UPI0009BC47EA|nr:GyrI-like domain-containing protein [Arabiibacter massiliensis]